MHVDHDPTLSSLINLSGVFLSPAFFLPNKSSSYLPVFLYAYSTVFNWDCIHEHVWMITWARAIYPWLHQRMTLLGGVDPNDTPQSMMECWWNQPWAHCGCELRQGFLKIFFLFSFHWSQSTDHWVLTLGCLFHFCCFLAFFPFCETISFFSPGSLQMCHHTLLGIEHVS